VTARRGAGAALAVVVALVALAPLAGLAAAQGDDDPAAGGPSPAPRATAEVTRRTLEEQDRYDATLGYGAARDLAAGRAGTLTRLPGEGAVIDRGGAVAWVDEVPVPLVFGALPFWRPLSTASEDGEDVRQLEEHLLASGFGTADGDFPDADFDRDTRAALKAWQAAVGVDDDGALDPSEVAVAPGPLRVARQAATIGTRLQGPEPVLSVTGTQRVVTLDVETADRGRFLPDLVVAVELPDGATTPGRVREVGRVAATDPGGGEDAVPTVEVTVGLDDPAAAGDLDETPVDVGISTEVATDALTVPVTALLALAEGGYAVERPDGRLIGVEVGAVADGAVAVTGDLAEGDEVVVPA